jgi:hydroxymethylglutaryl-CoA lyase
MKSENSVTIVEVGPRDGLQYEKEFFPTDKKIELVNLLSETGITRIEVSSFVNPKIIPQFIDTVEVLNGIKRREGVLYSALVPNIKGCQRALEVPVDVLAMFVSASEAHNKKNVNMSIEESLTALREVAKLALGAGKQLRGYVVTAFGCPYEGRIPLERVLKIITAYAEMGVKEISLGDTTGMANPIQVETMVKTILDTFPSVDVAVHFHDSRGTGMANALVAYQTGIRIFDGSLGGIGGCPTAFGAMGNIATEDMVNMFEEMGIDTGIDFDKLLEATAFAQEVIGTPLPSHLLTAKRPNWNGAK